MSYRETLNRRNEAGKQVARLDNYKEVVDRRVRSSAGERRTKFKQQSCAIEDKKKRTKFQYNVYNALIKQEKTEEKENRNENNN